MLNILFYIFGIFVPIILILLGILKKKKAIIYILIAVILFFLSYILKTGGINLFLNKDLKEESFDIKEVSTDENEEIEANTKSVIKAENGLTFIDGILIVNKTYPLPEDYIPTDTYKDASGYRYCVECINNEAYDHYKIMEADALAIGLNIWIQSGYRSYELQKDLYNGYVERDGKEAADTYSARPGHSEHQTGLAFDLNTISDDFQYTDEGKWVNENAWKYGFILRYPKGKENITGYKYESWHLRYVGEDLAEKLYNNGNWITLEEYFDITSTYEQA